MTFLSFRRLSQRWSYRTWSMVGAVIVCGLVAAGVAVATIPDSSGIIHGCYQTNSGNLRVVDNGVQGCRPSETVISWNAVGPRGPSNAFYKDQRGSFSSEELDGNDFSNLLTLSLPTGSYVVNATVALVGTTVGTAQCRIHTANNATTGNLVQQTVGGPNIFALMPLTHALTLTGTTDVSILCRASGSISTQPSIITAIQVGTLTTQ
jgi:hypothetical protein